MTTHARFVQKSGVSGSYRPKHVKAWTNPPDAGKLYLFPGIWFPREINTISPLRVRDQFLKALNHWPTAIKSTPFGIPTSQITQHKFSRACNVQCSCPGPGSPVLTAQKQFFFLLLRSGCFINPSIELLQQIYQMGLVGKKGWSRREDRDNQKPVHWRVCTNIKIPNLDKVPLKCFFVSWS